MQPHQFANTVVVRKINIWKHKSLLTLLIVFGSVWAVYSGVVHTVCRTVGQTFSHGVSRGRYVGLLLVIRLVSHMLVELLTVLEGVVVCYESSTTTTTNNDKPRHAPARSYNHSPARS